MFEKPKVVKTSNSSAKVEIPLGYKEYYNGTDGNAFKQYCLETWWKPPTWGVNDNTGYYGKGEQKSPNLTTTGIYIPGNQIQLDNNPISEDWKYSRLILALGYTKTSKDLFIQ